MDGEVNIMKSRTKKGAENSLHEVTGKTERRLRKRMKDPTLEGRDENKVGRIPERFGRFPAVVKNEGTA
jgi:hypothetical protein